MTTETAKPEFIPFNSGLDLVNSKVVALPGSIADCLNWEYSIQDGYKVIDGYSRFFGNFPTAGDDDFYFFQVDGIVFSSPAVHGSGVEWTNSDGSQGLGTLMGTGQPFLNPLKTAIYLKIHKGAVPDATTVTFVDENGATHKTVTSETASAHFTSTDDESKHRDQVWSYYVGGPGAQNVVPGMGLSYGVHWFKGQCYFIRDYIAIQIDGSTTGTDIPYPMSGVQFTVDGHLYKGRIISVIYPTLTITATDPAWNDSNDKILVIDIFEANQPVNASDFWFDGVTPAGTEVVTDLSSTDTFGNIKSGVVFGGTGGLESNSGGLYRTKVGGGFEFMPPLVRIPVFNLKEEVPTSSPLELISDDYFPEDYVDLKINAFQTWSGSSVGDVKNITVDDGKFIAVTSASAAHRVFWEDPADLIPEFSTITGIELTIRRSQENDGDIVDDNIYMGFDNGAGGFDAYSPEGSRANEYDKWEARNPAVVFTTNGHCVIPTAVLKITTGNVLVHNNTGFEVAQIPTATLSISTIAPEIINTCSLADRDLEDGISDITAVYGGRNDNWGFQGTITTADLGTDARMHLGSQSGSTLSDDAKIYYVRVRVWYKKPTGIIYTGATGSLLLKHSVWQAVSFTRLSGDYGKGNADGVVYARLLRYSASPTANPSASFDWQTDTARRPLYDALQTNLGIFLEDSYTAKPIGVMKQLSARGASSTGAAISSTEDIDGKALAILPHSSSFETEGSQLVVDEGNFYSKDDSDMWFGATGASNAFCVAGDYWIPIETGEFGLDNDWPRSVAVFDNQLALGYKAGVVIISSIGEPVDFDALKNAAIFGVGDQVTGLAQIKGKALAVFGKESLKAIALQATNSVPTYELTTISRESGAIEYSIQNMDGSPIFCDYAGIRTIDSVDKYGSFEMGTLSHNVTPFIRDKIRNVAAANPNEDHNFSNYSTRVIAASCLVRNKNQYRLYFTDGDILTMTLGEERPVFTAQKYVNDWETINVDTALTPTCVGYGTGDSEGEDHVFAFLREAGPIASNLHSESRFIYKIDDGADFDNYNFDARLTLNHIPMQLSSFNNKINHFHVHAIAHNKITNMRVHFKMDYEDMPLLTTDADWGNDYRTLDWSKVLAAADQEKYLVYHTEVGLTGFAVQYQFHFTQTGLMPPTLFGVTHFLHRLQDVH